MHSKTATQLCTKTHISTITTHTAFGVLDSRGREIGAQVAQSHYQYTAEPNGVWGYTHEEGIFIEVRVHATRDGKCYGASHRGFQVALNDPNAISKVADYVAKRLTASRKAAHKKAAQAAA